MPWKEIDGRRERNERNRNALGGKEKESNGRNNRDNTILQGMKGERQRAKPKDKVSGMKWERTGEEEQNGVGSHQTKRQGKRKGHDKHMERDVAGNR